MGKCFVRSITRVEEDKYGTAGLIGSINADSHVNWTNLMVRKSRKNNIEPVAQRIEVKGGNRVQPVCAVLGTRISAGPAHIRLM